MKVLKHSVQCASVVSVHKKIICIAVLESLEMNEHANSLQVAYCSYDLHHTQLGGLMKSIT